jgi:hypothetical protein
MRKTELDSILLVNLYFTGCKLQNPYCSRTETVRKYLTKRIKMALVEGNSSDRTSLTSKAFVILCLFLVTNF